MKKNNIYIIGLLFFFSSCTEIIELDLNSDDNVRLVVDAFITTDTLSHVIDLSLTTDYFETGKPDKAENAVVSLSDGSTTINLVEMQPGKYHTPDDYAGEEGKNYTLNIDYDGTTYVGSTTLYTVTTLDSISVLEYDGPLPPGQEEGDEFANNYAVYPFFQEPSSLGNYYLFKMLINGEYYTETLVEWLFASDELSNGVYFGEGEFFTFYAELGDEVTFEMFSLTEADYENLFAILLETEYRGGLFDAPPANIPTNLTGGAVGQFIMADVERKTVIIE